MRDSPKNDKTANLCITHVQNKLLQKLIDLEFFVKPMPVGEFISRARPLCIGFLSGRPPARPSVLIMRENAFVLGGENSGQGARVWGGLSGFACSQKDPRKCPRRRAIEFLYSFRGIFFLERRRFPVFFYERVRFSPAQCEGHAAAAKKGHHKRMRAENKSL